MEGTTTALTKRLFFLGGNVNGRKMELTNCTGISIAMAIGIRMKKKKQKYSSILFISVLEIQGFEMNNKKKETESR